MGVGSNGSLPLYTHDVGDGFTLNVYDVSTSFVILCEKDGKAGKTAAVEHCSRCAWAACFRLHSSGKWKELAPTLEEDQTSFRAEQTSRPATSL